MRSHRRHALVLLATITMPASADIDYRCLSDCNSRYSYAFCVSQCTYEPAHRLATPPRRGADPQLLRDLANSVSPGGAPFNAPDALRQMRELELLRQQAELMRAQREMLEAEEQAGRVGYSLGPMGQGESQDSIGTDEDFEKSSPFTPDGRLKALLPPPGG